MTVDGWSTREALERAHADDHGSFVALSKEIAPEPPDGRPLGGLPFAAKDNIDTREFPTSANTPALLGTTRERDNPVLTRLAVAGARLIGKTNTHELALGITTSAGAFPASRNPLEPARSPGGSSGGSGAAVAAGIVPFALGTDTGGSISIPAAWCGVFGLRPTTGRWPVGGVVPLSRSRDTVGVIGESVEILAAVDSAVVDAPTTGRATAPVGPIRIGIPEPGTTFTARLADPVRDSWEESLERLRGAGAVELVRVDTEEVHQLERRCGHEIEFFEMARCLGAYLAGLPRPLPFAELVERVARDDVREALRESGRAQARSDQYAEALAMRVALQARYDALFATHGIAGLLYPTVPITAPMVGEDRTSALGTDEDIFEVGTRNVNPGSVSGQPVVTLPGARGNRDGDSSAAGISLEGARGDDRRLLATARLLAPILSGYSLSAP
ncbi:hypothetical protein JD276_10390 [Leucobacter sp. CSA1]|uniref:Amidase domain-containing protein n=1 Tax=Leucobacter chromiisoli TaxID=2796471 RepID=A0A934Q7Y1_9MICO|nr:amidase family protein [Leucobacter chromiisoli]MBK0419441.1 hypothetical protein [Leucobacter chromiisoli]